MPDIIPSYQPNIKEELKELSRYKFHPNGIQNHTLDRLTDMLDGKVELMDPSNPFLYLLESSCLNTSFAIQEYLLTMRKLYPRLANNNEDLYLHMSDFDYLGRFGEPADAGIIFNIDYRAFKVNAHRTGPNGKTGDYVLKIPKHFQIEIDSFVFTLLAPIIIRETENGILDLKIDLSESDEVYPYSTNFIKYDKIYINEDEIYITFGLSLPELLLETTEVPIEKNSLFRKQLSYTKGRQFHYFKAYRLDATNNWQEMLVTHTDQVYDIDVPTCIVKVLEDIGKVEYYIPPVYINSGKVSGKVKFVIYTTQGAISVNFSDYDTSEFKGSYNKVFPETDLDVTSNPLNMIPKVFYIEELVVGGKAAVSFEQLKEDVIDNSIGDRELPVTDRQLSYLVRSRNFKLLKGIDTITDRIYLLETSLPANTSRGDISRFNLDIIEYKTTLENLINTNRNYIELGRRNIIVLEKGSLFEFTNGKLNPLSKQEVIDIENLSNIDKIVRLNNNKYLSLYYHYILDYTTEIMDLRAYELENPRVTNISFDDLNNSTDVSINIVGMPLIEKVSDDSNNDGDKGYVLSGRASYTSFDDSILSTDITPYLYVEDRVGGKYFLESETPTLDSDIDPNGDATKLDDVINFEFRINSAFAIDKNNRLYLTNFANSDGSVTGVDLELLTDIKVIFVTNNLPGTFQEGPLDTIINGTFISGSGDPAVVSMENIKIKFGEHLDRLYARLHISVGDQEYETYDEDQPQKVGYLIWNAQDSDPEYEPNDILTDENDIPIIAHRAGDVKLDEHGDPIPIRLGAHNIYMNLLFIDQRAEVATNTAIRDYYNYTRSYLSNKIVKDANVINDELLENTESLVVVPKSVTDIVVNTYSETRIIGSLQSFKINVYVEPSVYNDEVTKARIYSIVVGELDSYLSDNTELKRAVILNRLYEELRNSLISIEFERFTELNQEYISLQDKNTRIGVNKLLQIDPTGFTLENDVVVSFMLINE